MFTTARLRVCVALTALAFGSLWAQDVGSRSSSDLAARKHQIQDQLALYDRQEAAARDLIFHAQTLLGDKPSAASAAKTIADGQTALSRIAALRQMATSRLLAIDRQLVLRDDRHASVGNFKGTVTIKRDGVSIDPREDPVLGIGDELNTGPDGGATLYFSDGAEVCIGSNSTFTMTAGGDPEILDGRAYLRHVLESSGMIRKPFRTPTAVAGARGTQLIVESSAAGSRFSLLEGLVDIRPASASPDAPPVTLKPGESVKVSPSGTVEPVEPFDPKSADPWWDKP